MVKLNEDMIVARTRVSDMNQVKKLNCWGAELSDISVIKKLRNVEVLSLSVNSISTLADIQHCQNLQELYIRKNCIPDISEICYLRDLPRLKNLWLEENPCAEGDSELYRQTVIRNIPQLQKLDNTVVTSEEMAEAMRRGLDLEHPLDGGSANQSARLRSGRGQKEEQVQQAPMTPAEDDRRRGGNRSSFHEDQDHHTQARKESVQSPSRRVSNAVWPETEGRQGSSQSQHYPGPQEEYEQRQTPQSRHHSLGYEAGHSTPASARYREATPDSEQARRMSLRHEPDQHRYSSASEQPPQRPQRHSHSGHGGGPISGDYYYRGQEARTSQEYYSQSRATTPGTEDTGHSPASLSLNLAASGRQRSRSDLGLTPVREGLVLSGLSRENSSLEIPRLAGGQGRASGAATPAQEVGPPMSGGSGTGHSYDPHSIVEEHYQDIHRQVDQQLEGAAQLVANRALSPQRPYPIRPKNRNSNVLSAILCLIKEIDGPSLEVVEMAVRCRMEELED